MEEKKLICFENAKGERTNFQQTMKKDEIINF